jgi:hypothetical protein
MHRAGWRRLPTCLTATPDEFGLLVGAGWMRRGGGKSHLIFAKQIHLDMSWRPIRAGAKPDLADSISSYLEIHMTDELHGLRLWRRILASISGTFKAPVTG